MARFSGCSVAEVVTFVTALLAGVSMIMGLNAVNSAPSFMLDYLKYVEGDENAVARNPTFWKNILTFYTVVTQVTQAAAEPLNLTQFACRFSFLFRLEVAAVGMILELLVIVVLPHAHTTEEGAIVAIILMAFIGGFCRAFFENTSYALFGPFPTRMMSAVLIGVAVSGSLVSLLQIILLAAMPSTFSAVLTQSAIYFGISIGIIALTGVTLLLLLLNPYARSFVLELASTRSPLHNIYRPVHRAPGSAGGAAAIAPSAVAAEKKLEEEEEDDGVVRAVDYTHPIYTGGDEREPTSTAADTNSSGHHADEPAAGLVRELVEEEGKEEPLTTAELLQQVALWPVIKKIYPMMFSCFLTFFVTYLIYPGVMLAVDAEDYWYTTLIMAVYNFCDLAGRVTSMWSVLWPPRWAIVAGSIARIIILPYLLLCATHVIPTQAAAYVGTAVMGVTNGFIGTLTMVYGSDAPGLNTEPERALAGQATGVCLLLGCAAGSLLQLAIVLPL